MDNKKYRFAIGRIITLATAATIALTAWSGPFAAQTASTAIVPFSEFVDSLTVAPADAYIGKSGMAVKSSAAFEAMRRHLVKMYSGVTVTHSIQAGNQVFDCVPINDQPGVRLRKLKTLPEPPPLSPTSLWGQGDESGALINVTTNAPAGQRCEDGTIPMRRLTLEELTRFKTLKTYFEKAVIQLGRHSYARAAQNVKNYGGRSYLGLWRPFVIPIVQGLSLSQQWYTGGSGNQLQTVEVGWQVNPDKYGTDDAVLFVFRTADGYNTKNCYNQECGKDSFVQTNFNWYLGVGFDNYSTVGGPDYYVHLGYYLYQGYWWLAAGDDWVGFYPRDFFAGGQLTNYADTIAYGGETSSLFDMTSWPPMGSGEFASAGPTRAAYHRRIAYSDANGTLYDPSSLTLKQTNPECYTITAPTRGDDYWGIYFFFGGPGTIFSLNADCGEP